ncbi:MAG: hypothetical protein VR67_05985 [Peptococcaceae bacterium BRH_c8a]|nr:MAG: hypothetical protein VR67_05985 [Peptococcaceae bacterium BRH_c8a]
MNSIIEDRGSRKADINIRFSDFDLPPMQDVLLIGRRAAIGPEAVRRMVDALAPGQYEVIEMENGHIEAIAVKVELFNWVKRERLVDMILEEVNMFTCEKSLIKAKLSITISITREVDI